MYKKAISLLIVALVLPVLLAACGGGDEAEPAPTRVPPTAPAPATPPAVDGGPVIEVTLADRG